MNLLDFCFPDSSPYQWQMELWERSVLTRLLEVIKPKVSMEIGTAGGGSASAISRYSGKMYSLDMRHSEELLASLTAAMPNVVFVTGKTQTTLAPLMARIASDQEPLEFILVDGSHQADGVRHDLAQILEWRPPGRCVIVMHDTFNPGCRSGIHSAPWAKSPWVQSVELDAVPGLYFGNSGLRRQMWGGFAIALLDGTKERASSLLIGSRSSLLHDLASSHSIHGSSRLNALKSSWRASAEVSKLQHQVAAQKAAAGQKGKKQP